MSILAAGLGEKICIPVGESLAGPSERVGRKRPSGAPRIRERSRQTPQPGEWPSVPGLPLSGRTALAT